MVVLTGPKCGFKESGSLIRDPISERDIPSGSLCAYHGLSAFFASIGRPWFAPEASHGVKMTADSVVEGVRLAFAALYLWIIVRGAIRSTTLPGYLAALSAVLVGVGLFATELSAVSVPGIWFPYGTGMARGQYAYAVFIPLLFLPTGMRLVGYARRK